MQRRGCWSTDQAEAMRELFLVQPSLWANSLEWDTERKTVPAWFHWRLQNTGSGLISAQENRPRTLTWPLLWVRYFPSNSKLNEVVLQKMSPLGLPAVVQLCVLSWPMASKMIAYSHCHTRSGSLGSLFQGRVWVLPIPLSDSVRTCWMTLAKPIFCFLS